MSSFLTINSLFILRFLIFSTFFSSIYCVLFKEFHMPLVEKRSHLHFYLHDTLTGKSPTAVRIARLPNNTFKNTKGPSSQISLLDEPKGFMAWLPKMGVALALLGGEPCVRSSERNANYWRYWKALAFNFGFPHSWYLILNIKLSTLTYYHILKY